MKNSLLLPRKYKDLKMCKKVCKVDIFVEPTFPFIFSSMCLFVRWSPCMGQHCISEIQEIVQIFCISNL